MGREHAKIKVCVILVDMRTVNSLEKPSMSTLVNQPSFFKSLGFLALEYVLQLLLFIGTLLFGRNFMWNPKMKKLKEAALV